MRLLVIPLVLVTVAAGVWVAGAAITNDFRASMALTTVWFAAAGLVCVAIARRSRPLRVPVLGSYVVAVAAIGGYLGLTTVRERGGMRHRDQIILPYAVSDTFSNFATIKIADLMKAIAN